MPAFLRCVSRDALHFAFVSCGLPAYDVGKTVVSELPCSVAIRIARACVKEVYGGSPSDAFVSFFDDMVFVEETNPRRYSGFCSCVEARLLRLGSGFREAAASRN